MVKTALVGAAAITISGCSINKREGAIAVGFEKHSPVKILPYTLEQVKVTSPFYAILGGVELLFLRDDKELDLESEEETVE